MHGLKRSRRGQDKRIPSSRFVSSWDLQQAVWQRMVDSYLDVWNKHIFPNRKLYGIKIIGAWYDSDRNQLVWIRVFDSEQERRVKLLDAYNHSPERTVVVPVASYHMASSFIRVGDADVFRPQDTPDPSVPETAVADQARKYAAARGGARAPH